MKQNPRSPIQSKTTTPPFLIAIAFLLVCFGLLPTPNAFGVSPPPDGGYPGNNTAEGADALFSLTSGIDNTGLGFQALSHNTTGNFNTAEGFRSLFYNNIGGNNTAVGVQALFSNTRGNNNTALGVNTLYRNTIGAQNTAAGVQALFNNTTGNYNTALGVNALYRNTEGNYNTATGWQALFNNTTGNYNTANGYQALASITTTGNGNTANGYQALFSNTSGGGNTANGYQALFHNTLGLSNTGLGFQALENNTAGSSNTAVGENALEKNNGSANIALGRLAGSNLTTGNFNIDIGNWGVAAESRTIRIGDIQDATYIAGISGKTVSGGAAVFVDFSGKLGTVTSSRRFKKDIADMDAASEALLALRPVTFRYKQELDPEGIPQFGLVAEDVEKVNPDLVVRDAEGKVNTVRYEAVNAMLLNEFLKEHRKNEEQEKRIDALTAQLKEQAAQIQKVSAQLEVNKPAPQVVNNNQ
jgi:hypothetical protein